MPPPRLGNANGGSDSTKRPPLVAERDLESDFDDASSADLMEKDKTEEQLEKLVFGDDAGFRSALKTHGRSNRELALTENDVAEDGDEASADGEELGDLDDADVRTSRHFMRHAY